MLIDSHCHLHDQAFAGDIDAVLQRAAEAGVERIITIGTSIGESRAALALAERYGQVFATVGVAPHDQHPFSGDGLRQLRELARHERVVALGEFGLDYHYNTWPRERQLEIFQGQLDLAAGLGMPVVVHSRDADDDMLTCLTAFAERVTQSAGGKPLGVMHCFSSTLAMAERCAALGFLISIAGPVTYRRPRALPDVVRALPLPTLLIETDAPFLAPQSVRGKRNEPAFVREIAQQIARLRAEEFGAVAHATSCNAKRLFWPNETVGA